MKKLKESAPNFTALIPLLVFVITFLGIGIYKDDFYLLPAPIAVIVGIVVAFLIFKQSVNDKIAILLKGCGDNKILTMCLIYLLAGAFAAITKSTGSVDAIVNLGMDYIAIQYIYLGIFLIAAFLSISTGTSVGAIVTLAPIVVGFSGHGDISLAVLCGALLGGSMFGDNLSVISDTTIAATQSLDCKMSDKFKENIKIALPAALITLVILTVQGLDLSSNVLNDVHYDYSVIKIVPYILVIILSVIGVNVFVTLFFGIISAIVLGVFDGDFTVMESTRIAYTGFTNMTEIFLLSLLTGGLAALVERNGGIDYILNKIKILIKSKRSAQFGIAALVSTINMAIANNTVSIIISGSIAKTINDEYGLTNRKTASILDIFACVIQGILPYGAQVLMILSFSEGQIDYIDLIQNTWYLLILFVTTILLISFEPLFVKKVKK
ncbi:Na+/H+ antiporter NhaC family protein [Winogradskyella undariae]|uniref:Na+/H+ antiporter NhaC family protein n=1 Tax=Winogradskyella TaxID=286104 RepID=UPI00156B6DF3|nr:MULTISPECIES: Na+/H+ antiporter NhaC family protein [Winogradskyella]NRR90543.1 Na+/H+ antiporter NhaC family protein [Winogradskyella undariae]QXP79617.1 Na+/H+ antiporter NhaC family protein [Winogradskyella sp. HaHa_3_26]